ncbi:hypothetical protein [Paenibacillus favisporus]|uniref:hypothetical protein n=1 Tax=Paenibacillus favisporus TaxID=221028 RepID=UPI00398B497D
MHLPFFVQSIRGCLLLGLHEGFEAFSKGNIRMLMPQREEVCKQSDEVAQLFIDEADNAYTVPSDYSKSLMHPSHDRRMGNL